MVPCLRLYAYLACQLARALPFADHEYMGERRGTCSSKLCWLAADSTTHVGTT
jgi:hypothetical protein